MDAEKTLQRVGQDILRAARSELYMALPYLDNTLCALREEIGEDKTLYTATDGELLYANPNYLADRYLRGGNLVNRLYLHSILHCMLRHVGKKRGHESALWDLACDIAVESILDTLPNACLAAANAAMLREREYAALRTELRVLTAEGIYRILQRRKLSAYELARLQKEFFADDHGFWDLERSDNRKQDADWQERASRARTALDTVLAGQATGAEAVYESLAVAERDAVDYRAFLRRFCAEREIMAVDDDTFDYGFYSYGLRLYGNVPLVEPTETREEKRIEDLVIAIDTSMSTSGEQVRKFLESTYSILRSSETFTRRFNIRILQCDDRLRRDDTVRDLRELKEYMEDFKLVGGSSTDFRPVFDYVEKLRAEGQFTQLRGLIYFTDGMGTYPKLPTPYETAFIMLQPPPIAIEFPPWAIRLILGEAALERAWEDVSDAVEYLTELPEL